MLMVGGSGGGTPSSHRRFGRGPGVYGDYGDHAPRESGGRGEGARWRAGRRDGARADGSSVRADNVLIAVATGSPGSQQIRHPVIKVHGVTGSRRSGSVSGGWFR